jgi:hypothetical protein
MPSLRKATITRNIAVTGLSALAAVTLLAGPAAAARTGAAPALLYNYQFKGTTGTVKNSAPGGLDVPLTLNGTWSATTDGVHFTGNTSGHESVAYGRPASGNTLNEPATAAVGFGTQIVYQAPAGAKCFAKTPNVTQIGVYSAHTRQAQAKLQLSGCGTSANNVLMQCRFAGSLTKSTASAVTNKLPLTNGDTYDIGCVKSPDSPKGTATITLTVTSLKDHKTLTNKFTVPAVGAMQVNGYISAGNKYPLAPPDSNTDQFNGDMNSTVYCAGTVTAVASCLTANLG